MILNAELIRAVLDGKVVQWRGVDPCDPKVWTDMGAEAAIVGLVRRLAGHEFRLKPEVKKTWLTLYDGRFINLRSHAWAIGTARYYGIKKLYRVEIDAATGEPIGVFVEAVE